jgi:formate hydrogenlyase subunit 3/multisubunit Na+/H+ antiporter MnhD subunit
MSGVMIKTGIYGILRTVTLLGSPDTWPLWWGPALIAAGSISAVYGVLNASGQRDIKGLLAYSSVENIGIVFTGLGLWMLGAATGNGLMSSLGLAGAMLHIWNHSIFKALLFLGAGAVAKATGTRDIEGLGGLLRSMRKTGLAFFTGSAAITGLPPLNGFPGEFLIYWAAFSGVIGGGSFLPTVSAVFAIGSLALTGGLAMVCFTRLFGIAFLGSPRSEEAAGAGEVSPVIYAPMLILAGLCVAGGVLAPLILRILPGVGNVSLLSSVLWKVTLASLMLPAAALTAGAARKLLLKARRVETAATWGCGYDQPSARMQYSASSFSRPVLLVFRQMLFLHGSTKGNTGLFPGKITLRTGVREAFTRCLYQPLFRGFLRASDRFSRLQHGRNQLYILYVALTLIVLLLWKLGVSP